ncbi:MAG: TonB-dependent receptor plug domain-containing protein [Armatimonadetes bacterium]|nr:TonB-dependent receptor plug domain-containing protein [Armatimonadota bacterium]
MSIEELMKIEVTSASKKTQPLNTAPAAITVITHDDIKRSGARSLAEALRLVPGIQIARTTQNYYAITARGFNNANFDGSFGNKLLVLIDGRSIYIPYTSTVYWEVADLLLEDVDRIEVIRGPGGSLYGANAVNGVINIITRSAAATQGGLLIGSAGTLELEREAFRYGWKQGDAAFRIFGKHGNDGDSRLDDGSRAGDGRNLNELGFRSDISDSKHGSLMFQGNYGRFGINESDVTPILTPPYQSIDAVKDMITASSLVGRWQLDDKAGGQTAIQAYYDLLDYPYTNSGSKTTTWDLDFQRQFPQSKFGSLIVGMGYRFVDNDSMQEPTQELLPPRRRDTTFSLFAQNQSTVNKVDTLTLGLKVEHNTYTGFEYQPSVRYFHPVDASHSWWGAVSRAVRTPSQTELNDHLVTAVDPPVNSGLPTAYESIGNPNLVSEHLIANEIGYRMQAGDRISLDVTAFYNIYTDLIYMVQGDPYTSIEFGTPVTVIPTYLRNGEHGNVFGGELETKLKLNRRSRLTFGYSYLCQDHFSKDTSIDSPRHQAFLRFSNDFHHKLKLDAMLYWYGDIPSLGVTSYEKLDVHLSWKPDEFTEASLGGQDLLHRQSLQFANSYAIPRSIYFQLSRRF